MPGGPGAVVPCFPVAAAAGGAGDAASGGKAINGFCKKERWGGVMARRMSACPYVFNPEAPEGLQFLCRVCGRGFGHPGSVNLHMRSHMVPAVGCRECGGSLRGLSMSVPAEAQAMAAGFKKVCEECREVY